MAEVTLTEAQLNARKNHYLEKIGKGKPKAKGTKSNPYKGRDLANLLKERFNNKKGSVKAQNTPITQLPELVEAEKNKARALTYGEAHQIQNNISDESKNALTNLRDKLAADEAKAEQNAPKAAPKTQQEPKTWTNYAQEHGTKYEQPKSGVIEADRRAAEAIKQNALKKEALANAENINRPFTTSAEQIDKQLGMGHKNPVSPNYAEEYGRLLDEKEGVQKNNQPKTWTKYAEEHGTKYEQPKSGVIEADRRAAEAIKQNKAKPKTWTKYAEEHGTKYEQPKSGVIEADRRAAEKIKQNALKKEALANAENINKPFTTTPEKIDKQLGLDRKYDVPKNYAEEYGKLMDEKYGKPPVDAPKPPIDAPKPPIDAPKPPVDAPKPPVDAPKPPIDAPKPPVDAPKPPVKPPIKPVNPGVVEGGKDVIKKGAKKPGFFKKIGNFFKGKKGKLALAAGAIGLLIWGLSKCTGSNKDKAVEPEPVATTPVAPTTPTEPAADKYGVEKEEGKMPKSYTIQKGNYPVGIIQDTYGVAYGTPEFKEIQKAVYEASGYERNTNLKVGDKFTLPDVTIGDKVYTADENAKVRTGRVVDNGLQLGRTKEVVKAGDKYYIVDMATGQRIPNEGPFDDNESACKRIDTMLEEEKQAA